jgi:hypothetical protein
MPRRNRSSSGDRISVWVVDPEGEPRIFRLFYLLSHFFVRFRGGFVFFHGVWRVGQAAEEGTEKRRKADMAAVICMS